MVCRRAPVARPEGADHGIGNAGSGDLGPRGPDHPGYPRRGARLTLPGPHYRAGGAPAAYGESGRGQPPRQKIYRAITIERRPQVFSTFHMKKAGALITPLTF